ncbi:MBL fold metallo-hydrolase [Neptunicella marina]|uniref:MBL fold metallo-hydrolase n=1 Tax=Neptunicella marina TaxID=2125989 RepID=A0A8J6M0J9_9ALTE|nr:MBL fold metallo-hydrolase [Neptunicella marina]MBC3764873.1 MBL fold metallo-hydrolase [Neptunicella marina]
MELTFYGVRGSTPAPGADFIKFGGNTACVHVALNNGTDIILDAGTGIIPLGKQLARKAGDIHLLLTHNHWDHIQGFPFFAPIYQSKRQIHITPGMTTLSEHDAILQQMSGTLFPVNYKDLPAIICVKPVNHANKNWRLHGARISRLNMNHPGSGSSYVIEADGAKIAYITDNELYPPYKKETDFLEFVEFAQHADLLIHDAQYLFADMPAKAGWGHSIAEEAVKLALACKAKNLALYSHDPSRTDNDLLQLESHCRSVVEIAQTELNVFAAAEGMRFDFSI